MKSRLEYSSRIVRTAAGYMLFAVLALIVAFVVLPATRLWPRGDAPQDLRAQRILHRFARFYMAVIQRAGIMRLSLVGAERLMRNGPHLIVANHPTLLDMVFLISVLPQCDCIVNAPRSDNFFLRGLIRAAGYVRNDAGASIVRECAERLSRGRSLVVFPEGTRSPADGLGPFQRGVARIALEAGCDLLPVAITCEPPTLRKGQKWYDLPERPFHATVRVLEPVSSESARCSGESVSVAARRLTAELRESLSKGLVVADAGRA
jgi:1-acyl-sn-glycerol-3-phosphate acyltransferase